MTELSDRACWVKGGHAKKVEVQQLRSFSRAAILAFVALLAPAIGCESAGCIGENCPDACNGAPCGTAQNTSQPSGSHSGAPCASHFDCAGVGLCEDVAVNGALTQACVATADAPPLGRFYTACPTTTVCDDDAGFFCIGGGVGDLDAYCTTSCTTDVDCPTGLLCESVSATPCEAVCDSSGDPSNPECVPTSEIGDGKEYRCGIAGLEHNICVKRRFCAPCETDSDCRAVPGLICAQDQGGEKICTQTCDEALNSCPWGNAAICGVWDDERGVATCAHRFGACHGSGAPCEPCYVDRDCGSTGLCYGSSFTGERYCIDLTLTCSCQGESVSGGVCEGGGCPDTPGGLRMLCYVGAAPSNPGICLGANANPNPLLASPQTGCWGPL